MPMLPIRIWPAVRWLLFSGLLLALVACQDSSSETPPPISGDASLSGRVLQQGSEQGLANWVVFLDLNNNGLLDPGEPHSVSDAQGNFSLDNLAARDYTVRLQYRAGWLQYQPRAGEVFGESQLRNQHHASYALTNPSPNNSPKLAQASNHQGHPNDASSEQLFSQIVGGSSAHIADFPWMVAIVNARVSNAFDGQTCGATLLRPQWLLTTAHCLVDENNQPFVPANQLDAVLGRERLSSNQGERVRLRDMVVFPGYQDRIGQAENVLINDVALLRLSRPVQRPGVAILSPEQAQLETAGNNALVLGWGNTVVRGEVFSDALLRAHIPLQTLPSCRNSFPNLPLLEVYLCAGFTEATEPGFADTGLGDSGGPLLVRSPDGSRWLQAGITSFGARGSYGFYSRVSVFHDWIESAIAERDPAAYRLRLAADSQLQGVDFVVRPLP